MPLAHHRDTRQGTTPLFRLRIFLSLSFLPFYFLPFFLSSYLPFFFFFLSLFLSFFLSFSFSFFLLPLSIPAFCSRCGTTCLHTSAWSCMVSLRYGSTVGCSRVLTQRSGQLRAEPVSLDPLAQLLSSAPVESCAQGGWLLVTHAPRCAQRCLQEKKKEAAPPTDDEQAVSLAVPFPSHTSWT